MISYILVFTLLVLSIYSDLTDCKIRNKYVFTASAAGIVINTCNNGIFGLKDSAAGFILPIVLLGAFFYIRLLGAGDIKLFSAIGALLGWKPGLYVLAYSMLVAGAVAFVRLLRANEFKFSILSFGCEMKLCLYSWDFTNFRTINIKNARHVIKLSPAIAAGVCINIITAFFIAF